MEDKTIFKCCIPIFKEKEVEKEFSKMPISNDLSTLLKIITIAAMLNEFIIIISDIIKYKDDLGAYSWTEICIAFITILIFSILLLFKAKCPNKTTIGGSIGMILFYVVQTELCLAAWGPTLTYINLLICQIILLALGLELYTSYLIVIISNFLGIIYVTVRLTLDPPSNLLFITIILYVVPLNQFFTLNIAMFIYFLLVFFVVIKSRKRQFYSMYINNKV